MKILIVEDDLDICEILRTTLEADKHLVSEANTLREAKQKVEDYEYDCILLDVMLPDGSGLDLLSYIKDLGRKENILILSAKDSVEDRVNGLNLGADDYLPKPFHIAELRARIQCVVRRNDHQGNMLIKFGNVSIDDQERQVYIDDKEVELNRKEFDLLLYFVKRSDQVVSKETIAEGVWGDHFDMVDNFDFLYAQMKNLRKKLSENGADIEFKAVYGLGYKLVLQ